VLNYARNLLNLPHIPQAKLRFLLLCRNGFNPVLFQFWYFSVS